MAHVIVVAINTTSVVIVVVLSCSASCTVPCDVGEAKLGTWQSHPLSRALISQPQAQSSLLLGVQRLVLSVPVCKTPQERQQLMQQLLHPFISFVMLSPDAQGWS